MKVYMGIWLVKFSLIKPAKRIYLTYIKKQSNMQRISQGHNIVCVMLVWDLFKISTC